MVDARANISIADSIAAKRLNSRSVSSCIYLTVWLYGVIQILSLANFVPVFDGWTFYKRCFMNAAITGDCTCERHTSFVPTIVYGVVAYVFPYNFSALAIVNWTLGLACCFILARSMSALFPGGAYACHLASTAFVLNPVSFAQAIQPNLDYFLALLTMCLISAFAAREFVIAFLLGLLMTSTKESGVMLYGVTLLGFGLVDFVKQVQTAGTRAAVKFVASKSYTILPLALFLLYASLFDLHGVSFGMRQLTLRQLFEKLFSPSVDNDILIAQFASLFALNFNWILTVVAMSGAAAVLLRRRNWQSSAGSWIIPVLISFGGAIFFHSLILVYNVPRYVLPLFVFLVCGAIVGFSLLWKVIPRASIAALLAFLALLIWSHQVVVDPVSKFTFGTFQFGEHQMLSTGGFRRLPEHGGPAYVGNNQLVYNLQFTKFGELAELAVRHFGYDQRYIVGPAFTWQDDFSHYIEGTGDRCMSPAGVSISFTPLERAPSDVKLGRASSLVYLEFPNVLNAEPLDMLKTRYELKSTQLFEKGGYSILGYVFQRRNNTNDPINLTPAER